MDIDYILCSLRGLYATPQVVYAARQVLAHVPNGCGCMHATYGTGLQALGLAPGLSARSGVTGQPQGWAKGRGPKET